MPRSWAACLIPLGISSCLRPCGLSGCVISPTTRCPVSHKVSKAGRAKSPVPSITIRVGGGMALWEVDGWWMVVTGSWSADRGLRLRFVPPRSTRHHPLRNPPPTTHYPLSSGSPSQVSELPHNFLVSRILAGGLGLAELQLELAQLGVERWTVNGANQVDEQAAVQVIGLVLDGPAVQVFGLHFDRIAVEVECLHLDFPGAGH